MELSASSDDRLVVLPAALAQDSHVMASGGLFEDEADLRKLRVRQHLYILT